MKDRGGDGKGNGGSAGFAGLIGELNALKEQIWLNRLLCLGHQGSYQNSQEEPDGSAQVHEGRFGERLS